jgi:hypothetical protein
MQICTHFWLGVQAIVFKAVRRVKAHDLLFTFSAVRRKARQGLKYRLKLEISIVFKASIRRRLGDA